MPDPESCQPVVELLVSRFLPGCLPPPLIMPPAQSQPQDTATARSQPATPFSVGPIRTSQPAPTPTPTQPPHTHGWSSSVPSSSPVAARAAPAAPSRRTTCTLWVGQIHDSISDEMLTSAFKRFGELSAYHIMRQSHCAFIDFKSHAAAAKAQETMNGSKLGAGVSQC